jgi:hypothetical protein
MLPEMDGRDALPMRIADVAAKTRAGRRRGIVLGART